MDACVGKWMERMHAVELTLVVVIVVVVVMVMVAVLVLVWGGWVDGWMNDGTRMDECM